MLLEDIDQESRDEGIANWDPAFPLDTVLVPDPLTRDAKGQQDPHCFGSFFVFRKLEQDVAGFKLQEQMLADRLKLTNEVREQAGAYVIGRFEDGTPITIAGEPQNRKIPRNDFNYKADMDAARCPFHAHIRKTNPRGGSDPDNADAERLHIMARRGITYEDTARMIHPDGLPESDSTDEFKTKVLPHLPANDVGLLFMAYNARLDEQFVFTQKLWANNINFPPPLLKEGTTPGIDPVIGMGANVPDGQIYPNEWDDQSSGGTGFDFMGFVHMKGGEYFFAPSLNYLRNL
jgi:deferrochelatase/peroxidase EfeB